MTEPFNKTTDFTGVEGFTKAERRGVQRLADRIRFELHVRGGVMLRQERLEKCAALAVLDEVLT